MRNHWDQFLTERLGDERKTARNMSNYRCFFLDAKAHIVGVEAMTDCANDGEARTRTLALLKARPEYAGIAVWERARKVFEELTPPESV
jgi:hypothetical protein